jgi:hypothetical protein
LDPGDGNRDKHLGSAKLLARYYVIEKASVPDPNPDPPDPHVFWPPGSGSFYHHAKIIRKILNPTLL